MINKEELHWEVKNVIEIKKSNTQKFKIEYQELSLLDKNFGHELQKSLDLGYQKEKTNFINSFINDFLIHLSEDEIDSLLFALQTEKYKNLKN